MSATGTKASVKSHLPALVNYTVKYIAILAIVWSKYRGERTVITLPSGPRLRRTGFTGGGGGGSCSGTRKVMSTTGSARAAVALRTPPYTPHPPAGSNTTSIAGEVEGGPLWVATHAQRTR